MMLVFVVTLFFVKLVCSDEEIVKLCEYSRNNTKALCANVELKLVFEEENFVARRLLFVNVTGSLDASNGSFSSIRDMSIGNSEIDDISLVAFPNVKILSLSRNVKIPDLTRDIFTEDNYELNRLSLKGNNHSIKEDSLHSLKNLRRLNIQNQRFEYLSGEFLKEASHLHKLIIKHCQLSRIDKNAFNNTPELEILNLNFNQIPFFVTGTLQKLNKLKILELRYNDIFFVDVEQFSGLRNLEVLGLPTNALKRIIRDDDYFLRVFPNLKTLKVEKKHFGETGILAFIVKLRARHIRVIKRRG